MDKKKKLIIEIVVFILLLIGITAIYNYLISQNTEQSIQENTSKEADNEETIEIIEIKNYEQFEQEVINESGTVFIDFYATWCLPCRTMNSTIKEIAKEHKEVKFVKVNIDKNEELATKYNVSSIPTMLIMENGEVTKTFIGLTSKESIVNEF